MLQLTAARRRSSSCMQHKSEPDKRNKTQHTHARTHPERSLPKASGSCCCFLRSWPKNHFVIKCCRQSVAPSMCGSVWVWVSSYWWCVMSVNYALSSTNYRATAVSLRRWGVVVLMALSHVSAFVCLLKFGQNVRFYAAAAIIFCNFKLEIPRTATAAAKTKKDNLI